MGRTLRDRPGAPEGNQNACKEKNNYSNRIIELNTPKGGTNQYYLTARLKRDNPEILEGLKNGEFKSVRQAAIAAGIIKVPTPFEFAVKAYLRLSDNEKKIFIETISQYSFAKKG